MHSRVRGGHPLVVEAHVERHRAGRRIEHRRLVHVVPDAGDAGVEQPRIERSPPRARGGPREIGEHARSGISLGARGPDGRLVNRAVRCPDEVISCQTGVVRLVSHFLFRMRIDDRDEMKSLLTEIGGEPSGIGKSLGVPRERLVTILIVDVEPDRVGRDATRSKILGDEADRRFRVIAVPALVIPERPQRRHRHPPGERRVSRDHVGGSGAVDEVVIQLSLLDAEREDAFGGVADVEVGARRVVEEQAVCSTAAHHDRERHGHVDRIGVGAVRERVAVPHRVAVAALLASALVEQSVLLAEPVHVLVDA